MEPAVGQYVQSYQVYESLMWQKRQALAPQERETLGQLVYEQRREMLAAMERADSALGRDVGPFIDSQVVVTNGEPKDLESLVLLWACKHVRELPEIAAAAVLSTKHATIVGVRPLGVQEPDWRSVDEFDWQKQNGKTVQVRWLAV
jgi:hypothetical protein